RNGLVDAAAQGFAAGMNPDRSVRTTIRAVAGTRVPRASKRAEHAVAMREAAVADSSRDSTNGASRVIGFALRSCKPSKQDDIENPLLTCNPSCFVRQLLPRLHRYRKLRFHCPKSKQCIGCDTSSGF